jgi:large conductance mechanosensitive channel
VVDLAVAVVFGAAFGAVINALVADIITPIIAAIGGKPDFSALDFTINSSTFRYGDFINAIIAFLVIAAAVFFLVVMPMNKLIALRKKEGPLDPTTKQCPECLSEVPIAATRCAHCTQPLSGAAIRG